MTSPVSGTVAAVLVRQGQSVRASEPVTTVVPDNASLQIDSTPQVSMPGSFNQGSVWLCGSQPFPIRSLAFSTALYVKSAAQR
nr:HlyD family efflux transporter periplasmic adaptor subunit [Enterobacter chengduensis]